MYSRIIFYGKIQISMRDFYYLKKVFVTFSKISLTLLRIISILAILVPFSSVFSISTCLLGDPGRSFHRVPMCVY